ncbi:methyl-accepting chemotaxis protein [Marinomonas sp. MED121]|uniref:methyl-accepting chemotaxis protein n=1 Tax=Marinomonas sp. MED121 TaxID=314277 RepID=UPI0000690A73|nr:HAMP domain-containing methyl-accepting chemotaxis protein [Marinomonas sp. MED121]EAQ63210.1 methyl-accepting chemotaxis protein [Marinomonas sp. MED121]
MLANMSFKLKLVTLFISAILGFSILTLVALNGFAVLSDASIKQKSFSELQLNAEQKYVEMIRLSDQLQMLTESSANEFLSLVDTKINELEQEDINQYRGLYNVAILNILKERNQQSLAFFKTLQEYVAAKQELGFDQASGYRANVALLTEQIHTQIKSVSFVLAKFEVMKKHANTYQLDSSADNFDAFTQAYDDYFARLKNFGLVKKFGEAPPVYFAAVKAFGEANIKVTSLLNTFSQIKSELNQQRDQASLLLKQEVALAEMLAQKESDKAKVSLIIASLFIAIFASLILFTIVKSVKANINNLSSDLAKVQAGDLTAKAGVNRRRNDEFDALALSLNGMTDGLGNVISNVVTTSQDVNDMVKELDKAVLHISESNGSISQQTSTLATATEEISQSVAGVFDATQDMKEQVKQTYESAQEGSKTIKAVLGNLGETVSIVGETSAQLDELGKLSADIDGVIGMINELAGQTNLLALNAAIEAARAGDAGRGFSVVADEVRSLASKTVDATSEISTIVSSIQSATKAAIDKMASSKENLDAIEQFSGKAEFAMHEIETSAQKGSDASIEMAASIEQVAQTTTSMSQDMEQIASRLRNDTSAIDRIEMNAKNIGGKVNYLADQAEVFTV